MQRELFNAIFNNEIRPLIYEISSNNSLIETKSLDECKKQIFDEYTRMNQKYKREIFNSEKECLLDRHKIASCICGAFLKISVFSKQKLIDEILVSGRKVEAYFYYVNELVSFIAACRFMTFFIAYDNKDNPNFTGDLLRQFPIAPSVTKNKRGAWTSVLFNLAQIKIDKQIGLEHYDMYAYAMIFFFLEKHFYLELGLCA